MSGTMPPFPAGRLPASGSLLAAGALDALLASAGWIVAAAIIVLVIAYGLRDVFRLVKGGFRRAWAISSVSFYESVRRRVLWITPVAILGVLAVAQFLDPVDPADAIRQTVKVCLFATGLLVTMTAIILACTNLPKEIDSRVIYTIVTKPTTRLEIVIGKVLGFARVSLVIILIMGVFTFAYVELRAWRAEKWVREQAAASPNDPLLQNLARTKLLATRSLTEPQVLNILARPPAGGPSTLAGGQAQFFYVPFALTDQEKEQIRKAVFDQGGQLVVLNVLNYEQRLPTPEEQRTINDLGLPMAQAAPSIGTLLPSVPSAVPVPIPIPQIAIKLFDHGLEPMGDGKQVNGGESINLPPAGDRPQAVGAAFSPDGVQQVLDADRIHVTVEARTPTVTYVVGDNPTVLGIVPPGAQAPQTLFGPAPSENDPSVPAPPLFQSHRGRYGMQIEGKANGQGTVGAYTFRGVRVPPAREGDGGEVILESRIGIESATDFETEANVVPRMTMQLYNHRTKQAYPPVEIRVESGQIIRTPVPRQYLEGGDFDVYLRGLNEGMWYGVEFGAVNVVQGQRSFAWNLGKSLFILWLLAILVVVIAVFTSTFLSWPIAVVLTVVILLGHWTVQQLSDATGGGLGADISQAFNLNDPTAARIVRTSFGALGRALDFISAFLPDLSKFEATGHIERGVAIPAATVGAAGWVLLAYGLPVLLLSYLILRNKEVAP